MGGVRGRGDKLAPKGNCDILGMANRRAPSPPLLQEANVATRPIRLLHTAQWMLGRPLEGIAELPPAANDLGFTAPLTAARRAVGLALEHKVDLVTLSGDLVWGNQLGTMGLLALLEILQPLARAEVPVIWAVGRGDPQPWPEDLELPPQLLRLSVDRPRRQRVTLADGRRVTIMSCGPQPDAATLVALLATADDGDPVIVASSQQQTDLSTKVPGIEYWAGPQPGPAQPRGFGHHGTLPTGEPAPGQGGAWLVELLPGEPFRGRFLPTSPVTFHELRLSLARDETLPTLLRQANEALGEVGRGVECQVVRLVLTGEGAITESFLETRRLERVRQAVNSHWTKRTVPATCLDVVTDPAMLLAAGQDEGSGLLVAYLRQLRAWSQDPEQGPRPAHLLAADQVPADGWGSLAAALDSSTCAEAARWGLASIGPDETP